MKKIAKMTRLPILFLFVDKEDYLHKHNLYILVLPSCFIRIRKLFLTDFRTGQNFYVRLICNIT